MYTTNLSENQLRQAINAEQALQAFKQTRQRAIGVRSAQTEAIYTQFNAGKKAAEEALLASNAMMTDTARMNKALAGVRFQDDITATLDLDSLLDARKTLSLAISAELKNEGLIGILRKADPSFAVLPDQPYSAANAVAELIAERMPQYRFDQLHVFPDALRQPFGGNG